jgi:hypothetical protein
VAVKPPYRQTEAQFAIHRPATSTNLNVDHVLGPRSRNHTLTRTVYQAEL